MQQQPTNSLTRRDFSIRLAALIPGFGICGAAAASALSGKTVPRPIPPDEINRSAEAIHEEVSFNAPPARVYEALINAAQFQRVVQLSAAMKSMEINSKPAEISGQPGGAFSLFGGYITGRHIELIPHQRLVQAWRVGNWDPGVYSITKFELSAQGSGTKLVFDHTGFPQGDAEHLLEGWKGNYWEPLAKFLGGSA